MIQLLSPGIQCNRTRCKWDLLNTGSKNLINDEICFIYQEPVKAPEQTTPRKMTLSLFDQDEEDEGDLFAAASSSSSSTTKQKETKPAEQYTVSEIHPFIS